MVKRLFQSLPGPLPLRILLAIIVVAVMLVALGFIFERAGDLLDNGGVIQ